MTQKNETVVLLHGIFSPTLVMDPLGLYLKKKGYNVINLDYPWKTRRIGQLADHVNEQLIKCPAAAAEKLHFAAHSMGGLVARALIARHRPENLGRVVMIGTPNHGSELADKLYDTGFYKALFGKESGQELTTWACAEFNQTSAPLPVDFEVGIIAANNPLMNAFNKAAKLFPGPSDGEVTIESTKIAGMKDHIIVTDEHNIMVFDPRVWKQTDHFLRHGCFTR